MPKTRARKFIYWLIFGVLTALLPILLHYGTMWIAQAPNPSLKDVVSKGELLIISVCMTSAAVGRLIDNPTDKSISTLVAGGFCVILIISAAVLFSSVSSGHNNNDDRVVWLSIVMYFGCFVSSGCCIWLSEGGA